MEDMEKKLKYNFHAFERDNVYYILDIHTYTLFTVQKLIYQYFRDIEDSKKSETDSKVLKEIQMLIENGFFQSSNSYKFEKNKAIKNLIKHNSRSIQLLITSKCNLKCKYCYERSNEFHSDDLMDENQIKTVINYLLKRGEKRKNLNVNFFGCEPLLNFKLIKFAVEYAKKSTNKNITFTITTNGTLLNKTTAEFLAKHEFGVMVSLDGPREQNDLFRVDKHNKGNYHKVKRGINLLLEEQKKLKVKPLIIRSTLTSANLNYSLVYNHFKTQFKHARIGIGSTFGTAYQKNYWDITKKDKEQYEKNQLDLLHDIEINFSDENPIVQALKNLHQYILKPSFKNKICGVGRNMIAITPTGDLYPCHRYVGMKNWILGNINNGGLNKKRLTEYYSNIFDHYDQYCSKCWLRFRCGKQCIWSLSHPDGHLVKNDQYICEINKEGEEKLLCLYLRLRESKPSLFT